MKLKTFALASALALSSTFAYAQAGGGAGGGSAGGGSAGGAAGMSGGSVGGTTGSSGSTISGSGSSTGSTAGSSERFQHEHESVRQHRWPELFAERIDAHAVGPRIRDWTLGKSPAVAGLFFPTSRTFDTRDKSLESRSQG